MFWSEARDAKERKRHDSEKRGYMYRQRLERPTIDMCRVESHKSDDAGATDTKWKGRDIFGPRGVRARAARSYTAINLCVRYPAAIRGFVRNSAATVDRRTRPGRPRRRDRGSYIGRATRLPFFAIGNWSPHLRVPRQTAPVAPIAHPIGRPAFPEGLIIRRLNWKRRS